MSNHLPDLPWAVGQFTRVANYWEAAGVIAAMRAGIDPGSVRRPLSDTLVSRSSRSQSSREGAGIGDVAPGGKCGGEEGTALA